MPSTYAILFIAVRRQEIRARARSRRLQHKFVCCDWWCWVVVSLLLLLLQVDAIFVSYAKNAINSIQIQLNGLDAHTLQPIGNKRSLFYGEILTHRRNDCRMLSESRPKTNCNSWRKLRQRSVLKQKCVAHTDEAI